MVNSRVERQGKHQPSQSQLQSSTAHNTAFIALLLPCQVVIHCSALLALLAPP